jgi:hypothetical protein
MLSDWYLRLLIGIHQRFAVVLRWLWLHSQARIDYLWLKLQVLERHRQRRLPR